MDGEFWRGQCTHPQPITTEMLFEVASNSKV